MWVTPATTRGAAGGWAPLAAAVACVALAACDRDATPTTPRSALAQPKPPAARSQSVERGGDAPDAGDPSIWDPMTTLQRLRGWRQQGAYTRMTPHLVPQQRRLVLAQLRAVDRLVAATNLFQSRVREQVSLAAAERYHSNQVANIVGVFSRDVELISQTIDGAAARVSYQVAGRVPLEEIELVRPADVWMPVLDPIEGMPEELLKLADVMERMAELVVQRKFTERELARELRLRQAAILRRLQAIANKASRNGDENRNLLSGSRPDGGS